MSGPALVAILLATWLVAARPVCAQEPPTRPDSAQLVPEPQQSVDEVARGPGPMEAFFKSLAVPGWGQAELDRHLTGALFVAFEGIAMSMTIKANQQMRYLESIDSPAAEGKRQEREDWIVLWVFNHLFSGLEAFVSAHLQEFPDDLRLAATPAGVTISIPLPRFP